MPRWTKGQPPRLAKNLVRHSTSAKGDKEEPSLNRDSAVSATLHTPGTLKDQRQCRPDKATQLPTYSNELTGQKLGDCGCTADRDHGSYTGSRSWADIPILRMAGSSAIRTNNSNREKHCDIRSTTLISSETRRKEAGIRRKFSLIKRL